MTNHRSTTHEEIFHHIVDVNAIGQKTYVGTVFIRKEPTGWRASASYRNPNDQFDRKIGRSISRRKYFQGKTAPQVVADSTYTTAVTVWLKGPTRAIERLGIAR